MRFNLIDKIEHLTDDRIVGIKQVTLAEEYLLEREGVVFVRGKTDLGRHGWRPRLTR